MLSVCIPVYNYFLGHLLYDLKAQLQKAGIPYEILLADDASDESVRQHNLKKSPPDVSIRWIFMEQNSGRAAIRNRLTREARYEHLLFMDCDTSLLSDCFIENYLAVLSKADVIVGGCAYDAHKPTDTRQILRWKYGRKRECSSAAKRQCHPYAAFSSFNFCIRKTVAAACPFQETFKDYGHEDTLLGLQLKRQNASILHIDNPLQHNGYTTHTDYLRFSRKAVEKFITSPYFQEKDMVESIRIWKSYQQVRPFRGLLSGIYQREKNRMEKQLCKKNPSLFLFDVYRLSYLCHYAGHPACSALSKDDSSKTIQKENIHFKRISIIVPFRNRADCIERCLQSIHAQTFRPIELLLIDNASSDESLSICRQFQEKYQRPDFQIQIAKEERPGACIARNTGLRMATGDYIAFFDSDDEAFPDMYADMSAILQNDKQLEWVACRGYLDSRDKKTVRPKICSADAAMQLLDPVITTRSCLIRRDFMKKTGGWNESLERWQDLEFGFRLLLHTTSGSWMKKPLFLLHSSKESISTGSYTQDHPKMAKALDAIYAVIKKQDGFQDKKTRIRLREAYSFKMVSMASILYQEGSVPESEQYYQKARTICPTKKGRLVLALHYEYTKHGGRGFWRIPAFLMQASSILPD